MENKQRNLIEQTINDLKKIDIAKQNLNITELNRMVMALKSSLADTNIGLVFKYKRMTISKEIFVDSENVTDVLDLLNKLNEVIQDGVDFAICEPIFIELENFCYIEEIEEFLEEAFYNISEISDIKVCEI